MPFASRKRAAGKLKPACLQPSAFKLSKVNTLIVSDMHFGSGRSLACAPETMSRLEEELAWADRLVIGGDLLETSRLDLAIKESANFCERVSWHVSELVLVPGNHEYWMVSQARQLEMVSPRSPPAQQPSLLLQRLFPGVKCQISHPTACLQEATVIHGHQLLAQLKSDSPLSDQECDQMLGPYFDAFWSFAQRPGSMEGALLKALVEGMGRITTPGSSQTRDMSQIVEAMGLLAKGHGLKPGLVIFGYIHQQLPATSAGDYVFLSPGGWVLDGFVRDFDPDPLSAHPGGVVRLTDQGFEHRRLLDDLSFAQLEALIGPKA